MFDEIKKDFFEKEISSITYLMRKYKINPILAKKYIAKLSRYAKHEMYDKDLNIITIFLDKKNAKNDIF